MEEIGNNKAFTLVELLVVISILAILAALVVPAIKNISHADATVSASRQLLDDVARARQLAISQRTTVYMVFVPTNFWVNLPNTVQNTPATTNLCDKQLTGYTFIAHGAMGDQPGNHQWHYLAPWQTLPDNTFIAEEKFSANYTITDLISGNTFSISQFNYTDSIPFPTATNTLPSPVSLPYIAFNYLGQLTSNGVDAVISPELIPLARGSVSPAIDLTTGAFVLLGPPAGSPDVLEMPPGNSANAYNIIDIEPLTGRATLLYHKIGP